MLKAGKNDVFNLENAIRGARNPMNSWHRMDSYYDTNQQYILGPNDLDLAQRLCNAGSDHRKFMRQIFVSVDITAPMYWWKEFDTYKVATTANSTSTMHKIHSKEFDLGDFSTDHMDANSIEIINNLIRFLEVERRSFIETKDKQHWWNIIQLLPASYNQLRTCTMSYETLRSMYAARKNHKLDEWHTLCHWIESLPYATELLIAK